MHSNIQERIIDIAQMRADVCNRLPANHPSKPPLIEPLQSIPADAEFVDELAVSESNIHESSSSHPQPTTQTSDPSILVELTNHYSCELPGFEPNLERASEIASDEVNLESPQQQEPNLQMATNTCTDLVIHPVFQPFHLNATHSNISFGIALRNLANKKSSSEKSSAFENPSSFLKDSTLVVQPLNAALPSKASLLILNLHMNTPKNLMS
jgi:hypothetical protein